jgi:hypothetical protein
VKRVSNVHNAARLVRSELAVPSLAFLVLFFGKQDTPTLEAMNRGMVAENI